MGTQSDKLWAPQAFQLLQETFYNLRKEAQRAELWGTNGAMLSTVEATYDNLQNFQGAVNNILAKSAPVVEITRYARNVDVQGSTFDIAAEYSTLLAAVNACIAGLQTEFGAEAKTLATKDVTLPAARFATITPLFTAIVTAAGTD